MRHLFMTLLFAASCELPETDLSLPAEEACGPIEGVVERVIDGDTFRLTTGEIVRLLLVDTPETYGDLECWGIEAKQATTGLLAGKRVQLDYDAECRDRYDRLLAYVWRDDFEVNSYLVEQGHACVLFIPPNGRERVDELRALEQEAREVGRGLWTCTERPC